LASFQHATNVQITFKNKIVKKADTLLREFFGAYKIKKAA